MGGSIKFDEHVSIHIYIILYTCNLVPHSVIHTYNIYMCIEAKIKHFRHFHPCLIIQWFEGSSWELVGETFQHDQMSNISISLSLIYKEYKVVCVYIYIYT